MTDGLEWQATPESAAGLGSLSGAFIWEQAWTEVMAECRARIAIAGLQGVGKSSLVNHLRGWEVSPIGNRGREDRIMCEDLGLFVLVDLPREGLDSDELLWDNTLPRSEEDAWLALREADLVLFLLDGEALVRPSSREGACLSQENDTPSIRLQSAEYQWFCRIRSLGQPMLVGLTKVDRLNGQVGVVQAELERRLARRVLPISVHTSPDITSVVLHRILEVCPKLWVPLGREMPGVRRRAANRILRQAGLLSALTGLEPVPLLDIPIQLASQMRMLAKLAALHGCTDSGDGSREVLAAVGAGLGLRLAVQQVAKLVPVLGWIVSGVLSGLTTWLLGWTAVAYFDGSLDKRFSALRHSQLGARQWGDRAKPRSTPNRSAPQGAAESQSEGPLTGFWRKRKRSRSYSENRPVRPSWWRTRFASKGIRSARRHETCTRGAFGRVPWFRLERLGSDGEDGDEEERCSSSGGGRVQVQSIS